MAAMTFGQSIDTYLADMQTLGRLRSAHSVRRYGTVLRVHHEDVGRRSPLRTTREDVKLTLARWRPTSSSQANAHSVMTSFYEWTIQEGLRKDNPARQVRRGAVEKPSVYRLTREEATAMMGACETAGAPADLSRAVDGRPGD